MHGHICLISELIGAVPTYRCYTEGQLSFGITNLACNGSEEHILNCTHSNPVLYNCQSHNDAGLVCQGNIILHSYLGRVGWAQYICIQ